jgi:hypothetical protein
MSELKAVFITLVVVASALVLYKNTVWFKKFTDLTFGKINTKAVELWKTLVAWIKSKTSK